MLLARAEVITFSTKASAGKEQRAKCVVSGVIAFNLFCPENHFMLKM